MTTTKILIVDDDQNIIDTLLMAFSNYDYQIEKAYDGEQAYQMISANKYDCILLDLRLPKMDGMDLLRELRPSNVILITAHGTIENAVEAMKAGCVDFIQKPFGIDQVRRVVKMVLERRQVAYEQLLQYESYLEAAKLNISERHYHRAMELVGNALEIKPESAEAFNFLGALHEILGDLSQAYKAYQTSHTLDPNYLPAAENLQRIISLDNAKSIILGVNK